MMRTSEPNARGGRLEVNFDLTTPEFPCGQVRDRVETPGGQSLAMPSLWLHVDAAWAGISMACPE